MSYCPECGEEVAEIDSFCPHCGITLAPIPVDEPSPESLESTIVISKEDLQESLSIDVENENLDEEKPGAEVAELPDLQNEFDSEPIEVGRSDTDEVGSDLASDDLTSASDSANIDFVAESDSADSSEIENEPVFNESATDSEVVDVAVETIGRTMSESEIADHETIDKVLFDELPSSSSSDQDDYFADSLGETGDLDDNGSFIESALENFAPDTDFDVTEAIIEPAVEEIAENLETPSDALPEKLTLVEEESFDSDATVVSPPEELLKSSEPSLEKVENDLQDLPADESIETKNEMDDHADIDMPSVPSILKPDFEFENEDISPSPSRFDSVSIMEKSEDLPAEVPPAPSPLESEIAADSHSPVVVSSPQPVIESVEERESRSYTSPNIGGNDTDGKRSKLKPLEEGTVLNSRYEIVRKIGGGGMGAVYLASDKNLGGVLRAVKEMVQSYIEEAQQDKAISDFKRESMLLTTLDHHAIPTIYDYFYDEKEARFYLVMKYINGGDLSSRLRSANEGRIDERSVVEWAIQVADVLDYLHQRQPPIVYRDLKPANIMLDGNSGKVMLIDFGIARWINKEEKGVTAVGTMGYAPPELFSGNVEPRSDIYSLGSTMFHLLTGADPQSNPLLIFDFQKNPRPRQINPQLSDQIEGILMLAVEYNADKRFSSTAEMRRALEDHLQNLIANRVTFGVNESPKAVTLSDEKVFCGFCGQSIVASDLFCAFCGAKQPIAQKGVHSENYSSVPVSARVTIIGTNELDSPSYSIEKNENLLGRRDPMSNIFPEVDLSKFDPQTKISRRHARIWRDGNKFLVEDLGSSNGTILMPVVNEAFRLVPNQPQVLTNGDRLKLGDTTLHFVIG